MTGVGLALALGLCFPASAAEPLHPPGPLPAAATGSQLASQMPPLPGLISAVAASALPPSAQAERAAQILSELSPQRANSLGNEAACDLAGRLIEGQRAGASLAVAATAAGGYAPAPAPLAAPQASGRQDLRAFKSRLPRGRLSEPRPSMRERLHHDQLWVESLWFYLVTNILQKWGDYSRDLAALAAAGARPAVSRPRSFFAHMRVMGQTGEFCIPGFIARDDAAVIAEARATFARYFDAPAIGALEREAFEAFLQRAVRFNAERRAISNFRKHVRDAMLGISTLPPAAVAAHLDSLFMDDSAAVGRFQAGAAVGILERFRQIMLEEAAQEPPRAKDRVLGVILIGSFALGAATPTSDLDVEPITADGSAGRVQPFARRVVARWAAEGRQKSNPVTFHLRGYLNSRWEMRAIHYEPYLVISPDPAVVENLAMRPGEPAAYSPSRALAARWRVLRGLQYAAVYLSSFFARP